ncbi:hypothetical protein C0J52_08344 [Blattella germanica]|nr:hypothetical protein C0J52_08344 [Blattella germanica]
MWRTLLVLVPSIFGVIGANPLEELYKWNFVEYDFPDQQTRELWIKSGRFQPNNTLLLDADYTSTDPHNRAFATTPSFGLGNPATLSTVIKTDANRVLLRPYPSWKENTRDDCRGLTSVLRIKLWVLDSGRLDILGKLIQKCPPKLRIYDLKTDMIIWQYYIPERSLVKRSLLGIVEVVGNCTHPFAYLADLLGQGIVVVNTVREESWRVQNNLTGNEEAATNFNVNGQSFRLIGGTISLAATKNTLYFHSLAGFKEHFVPLHILNNPDNFVESDNSYQYFHTSTGQRTGQSGPTVIARESVMFFSNFPENALYCWRIGRPYVSQNLHLLFSDVKFQFAGGLKIIKDRNGEEWIIATTSRFQDYVKKIVNPHEINYRILRVKVDSLFFQC